MIEWYENLYLDEVVSKKWDRVKKKIEKNRLKAGVTCITIASNPENLFDIMDSNELLFPHYKRNTIFIVGVAMGRWSAIKLVEQMVMDMYRDTGAFRAREYFQNGRG